MTGCLTERPIDRSGSRDRSTADRQVSTGRQPRRSGRQVLAGEQPRRSSPAAESRQVQQVQAVEKPNYTSQTRTIPALRVTWVAQGSSTRANGWTPPDDPEELRNFFLRRAQERDRAGVRDDNSRRMRAATKTPKETRDNIEPEETPTKPNRGPGAKAKKKPKPYTIRYLTLEEARALNNKTEDYPKKEIATPEQPAADEPDRSKPVRTIRETTADDRDTATNGHGTKRHKDKVQEGPIPDQPDSQPGHPESMEPESQKTGQRGAGDRGTTGHQGAGDVTPEARETGQRGAGDATPEAR